MSNRTSTGTRRPATKPIPSKQRSSSSHAAATEAHSRRPASLSLVLCAAALLALVLIAYSNSLRNGFVWDDHQQIVMNPNVTGGTPVAQLWTSDARFVAHSQSITVRHDYRPLQMLAYRAIFAEAGADAAAFHACNLAFAAAGTLAAFAVFWWMTKRRSLACAAAALFAVYPVHTEAVDWIASLPDLAMTLFVLLSFWLYLAWRAAAAKRWLLLGASLAAFAIALLWKETAVVYPLLILLYAAMMEAGPGVRLRSAAVRSAPYWGVLAGYLGLRLAVLGSLKGGALHWQLTPLQYVLNDLYLMLRYWAKLALPVNLNAYDSVAWIRSIADPRAIMTLLMTIAVLAGIAWLWKKQATTLQAADAQPMQVHGGRLAIFAGLWVFVTLLPPMDLGSLGRNPFTERYLYLPSVGFCLLIALAGAWLCQRLPAAWRHYAASGLLALALLGCLAETISRNTDWKDDATLFAKTLKSSPNSPFVLNMVASEQSSDPSHVPEAVENYRAALRLAKQEVPVDRLAAVVAEQGLASIDADRGQFSQALALLDDAEQMDPDDANANGERGIILARSGHGREAEPMLERSLEDDPDNENVLVALGLVARDDLHDPQRAIELFTRALAVHRADDDFAASQHNNLGAVYADQGNFTAAVTQLREAERILPDDPEFHANLANALAAEGQFEQARSEAEIAVHLAPQDPAAQHVLSEINQQLHGR